MMIWILAILKISSGYEQISKYFETYDGHLSKMKSIFEKIYLPKGPLLSLDIGIQLRNKDGELSEYPDPKPKAYGSLDGVPNEKHHDFYLNLERKHGKLVSSIFPRSGSFIIVRIDGGLLDELHMFNAYTVRGWEYTIFISAYYCPSGKFTIAPWNFTKTQSKYCDIPIVDTFSDIEGIAGSLIYVSESTATLTVESNSNFSISSTNFQKSLESGEKNFKFPKTGWWYFIGNFTNTTFVNIKTEDCFVNITTKCLNETIYYKNHASTFNKIPENPGYTDEVNETILHVLLPIAEDDIKYRYAVSLKSRNNKLKSLSYSLQGLQNPMPLCESDSKNYCKKHSDEIIAEIEYAKLGDLYITIEMHSNDSYFFRVFRSKIGDNMCNSQPDEDYDDIVYFCYCLQNTGGFYCEKDAISDTRYWVAIMFLTLSNLTMCLAVVYGFRIKAYVEITAYAANMIASYIYHWCDEQYYCFGFSSYSLRVIDFILSFYSVCVSIIYLAKLTQLKLKFSLLLSVLIILLYLGLGTGFSMFESSILVIFIQPLIIVSLVPFTRFFLFIYNKNHREFNKSFFKTLGIFLFKSKNFRIKWLGFALIFLISALVSRGFQGNYNYYIVKSKQTHSLWHVFIMLTAFSLLRGVYYDDNDFKFKSNTVDIEVPLSIMGGRESKSINSS
jgi:hypothetical protein